MNRLVLGIETSCDETAIAVVKDGKHILSNVIASQIERHRPYGGVFPEVASREHTLAIVPVLRAALEEAGVTLEEIDLIAVAKEPGLIGSLLVGVNFAKGLALSQGIPLIGVHHVEAHIASALLGDESPEFPALGVIVSGGHTALVYLKNWFETELISHTIDDAVGEAFDKVAKILGLPYPGGPEIEKLAKRGDRGKFPFRSGKVKGRPWHFSLSGLKTSVMYALQKAPDSLPEDIAASFQHTVFQDISDKVIEIATLKGCRSLIFGGGVANSRTLREYFAQSKDRWKIFFPEGELALDNGAMIAAWGYHCFQKRGGGHPLTMDAVSRSGFGHA